MRAVWSSQGALGLDGLDGQGCAQLGRGDEDIVLSIKVELVLRPYVGV